MRSTTFCLQTLLGLVILSACGCGVNTDEGAQGGAGGIGAGGIGGEGGQGGGGGVPCVVGATCSDGDACTQTDVCVDGACVGQAPVTCSSSKVCTTATCNPQTGACEESAARDGAVCGQNGACQIGGCVAAKLRVDVFDKDGLPIPGATVTYNGTSLPVDSSGSVEIDAPESHMVARVEAPYYAPASAVADVPPGTSVGVVARLLSTGAPMPVDITVGGTVGTDKVRVTLPPGSVVDNAGMPVSGVIGVTVTPVDPTGPDLAAMPGPLTGINAAGQSALLLSQGMVEVGLWQGGQPLQLAPGASATLEIILPDALQTTVKAGDSIPAWYFDLDAGTWKQDGAGLVTNAISEPGKFAWQAQVGHFTWWNADFDLGDLNAGYVPEVLDCVNVEVIDSGTFQPINGATIRTVGTSVNLAPWGAPSGVLVNEVSTGTTSGGNACVHVIRPYYLAVNDVESQLSVTKPGYTIASVEAPINGTIPGFSVDTDVKPLVVTTTANSGEPDTCSTFTATTHCLDLKVYMRRLSCVKGTVTAASGAGGPTGATIYGTYSDAYSASLGPISTSSYVTANSYCLSAPLGQQITLTGAKTNSLGATYKQTQMVTIPPNNINNCADPNNTCVIADMNLVAAAGQVTAGSALGSNALQIVKDLATNSNGDVAIVGHFVGSATFGTEPALAAQSMSDTDAFLVRIALDGSISWVQQLGGLGTQQATGVAFDSLGNIVVTGSFNTELRINATTYTSGGAKDGFVAKFSPSGASLWASVFGGLGDQLPEDIVVDTSPKMPVDALYIDNIHVVGHYNGTLGNMCGSCAMNPFECEYPCGNGDGTDAFVLKFYATGDPLFGGTYGGPGSQRALAATIGGNGDVYMVGDYEQTVFVSGIMAVPLAGGVDPFLAKFSSLGDFMWAKSLGVGVGGGDVAAQSAVSVAVDNNGDVFVAGNFDGTMLSGCSLTPTITSNDDDIFVAKYNSTGSCGWGRQFGSDSLEQSVTDVVVLQDGNLLIAGSASSNLQFNGAPIPPIGSVDFFIAKLAIASTGNPMWNKRWGNMNGYGYGTQIGAFSGGLALAAVFGGNATFTLENVSLTPTPDTYPDIAFLRLVQ